MTDPTFLPLDGATERQRLELEQLADDLHWSRGRLERECQARTRQPWAALTRRGAVLLRRQLRALRSGWLPEPIELDDDARASAEMELLEAAAEFIVSLNHHEYE